MRGMCINQTTTMKLIVVTILLNSFKLIHTQKDTHLTITSEQCGKTYNMAWYKSAYLEYHGTDLGHNPCSVEFKNEDATNKYICVSTQEISLGCGTKLEYHQHFIKSYYQPERKILCDNATLDEWCSEKYIKNVFIVIRRPDTASTVEITRLRVFRKESPGGFWRSGLNIFLVAILPAVVILAIGISIACYCSQRNQQIARARRVQYQTTSGAVTLQTGQGYNAPPQPVANYQPVPQGVGADQLPSGYQIHTMQAAGPVNQGTRHADGNQPLVQPSAPPLGPEEDLPPSYDSLWTKRP